MNVILDSRSKTLFCRAVVTVDDGRERFAITVIFVFGKNAVSETNVRNVTKICSYYSNSSKIRFAVEALLKLDKESLYRYPVIDIITRIVLSSQFP